MYLLSARYEGHVLFVNYNAGYTKQNFPEDLKEALIKLFLLKRNEMLNKINSTENTEEKIPEEINATFESYRRKSL